MRQWFGFGIDHVGTSIIICLTQNRLSFGKIVFGRLFYSKINPQVMTDDDDDGYKDNVPELFKRNFSTQNREKEEEAEKTQLVRPIIKSQCRAIIRYL